VFSRYIMLNTFIVSTAFGVAASFVGISWARHSTAVKKCISDFFQDPTAGSSLDTESQTLCKIFTYLDDGIMTGLWILLAIVQVRAIIRTRPLCMMTAHEYWFLALLRPSDEVLWTSTK
jgi:hypothetical protein